MGTLRPRHRWQLLYFALVALAPDRDAALWAQGVPLTVPGSPFPEVYEPGAPFIPSPAANWTWTLLPEDLLYDSYLAAPRDPRMGSAWLYDPDQGWYWDLEIGARAGLLRYGSPPGSNAEGWQLDVWGAALPRLNLDQNYDLDAADFYAGLPLTWSEGPWQAKFELRHLSSHVGDEYLLRNPGFMRRNYVRDSIVFGGGYFPTPDIRLYGEADYAFRRGGGAEPWHLRFGVDYSPQPALDWLGWYGMPFLAVGGELREEVDFGGGVNAVAGWQFRGPESRKLLRVGLQYYNGKSLQFSFFDTHEELIGLGIWYDY